MSISITLSDEQIVEIAKKYYAPPYDDGRDWRKVHTIKIRVKPLVLLEIQSKDPYDGGHYVQDALQDFVAECEIMVTQ